MISKLKSLFGDSKFYKSLLLIALPIVIQSFIASSLNLVDTIIVGRLGEAEIASVGIANQYFLLFNVLIFGIYGGCGIFISQFWGKRDIKNIRRVLGLSIILGCALSILLTLMGALMPDKIIMVFTKDPKVILLGAKFLRIMCMSYIFTSITLSYACASRCIGNAVIPMVVSMVALTINTTLNYILVFGKFGFASMGVEGSATATLIARIFEMLLMVTIIYTHGRNKVLAAKFEELFDITKDFIIRVFKTILPVVLNEACWVVGTIIYSVVYSHISTEAIASVQICSTINNVFFVLIFGLSNASTVMIGNKIGSGEEELGKLYARRFSILGTIVGLVLALLLALSAPSLLSFFKVSDEVLHASLMILYVTSFVLVIKVFNIILIVGILRGGGDAKYSLIAEASTMWLIGVPISIIGAFWFNLPVYWVVALITAEEIVKCVIGLRRLLSNKWIHNVTHNM